MLIVLTSAEVLENEAQRINALFEAGLEVLHFRKPTMDREGYAQLLGQVDPKFYPRIMLHQYHDLVATLGLRGAHLQEQARYDLGDKLAEYIHDFEAQGYRVSSSFHSTEAIEQTGSLFAYVLLSPVFGSLSKSGYQGKGFDVTTSTGATIIGMGGIDQNTIAQAYTLGFQGVAVLGGVWNAARPLAAFHKIKAAMPKDKLSSS